MKSIDKYLDRIGAVRDIPFIKIEHVWRYMLGITNGEYDIPRERLDDYPIDFEIAHFSYSHPKCTMIEIKRIDNEAEFRETFSDWKLPE